MRSKPARYVPGRNDNDHREAKEAGEGDNVVDDSNAKDGEVGCSDGVQVEFNMTMVPVDDYGLFDDDMNDDEPVFEVISFESNTIAYARRLFYLSHAFSHFSDVTWQFCIVLFLLALANYNSLLLVSTYGLTCTLGIDIFGAILRQLVHNHELNRLVAAQTFIWTKHVCILIATVLCYTLIVSKTSSGQNAASDNDNVYNHELQMTTQSESNDSQGESRIMGQKNIISVAVLVGIHFHGAMAQMLHHAYEDSVECDWLLLLSQVAATASRSTGTGKTPDPSQPKDTLRESAIQTKWIKEANFIMKQIDLCCKLVAPIVVGVSLAFMHNEGDDEELLLNINIKLFRRAAILVSTVNIMALLVQCFCTERVFNLVPNLSTKKKEKSEEDENKTSKNPSGNNTELFLDEEARDDVQVVTVRFRFLKLPDRLQIYLQQSISMRGIGFAMLHLNALTFDSIMIAYLIWRGLALHLVAIWCGIAYILGVSAPSIYDISINKMSLEFTGLWSITYGFICISISFTSFFFIHNNNDLSLMVLMGGACVSRIGFLVFELTMKKLVEEEVPEDASDVVQTVQQSLNNFFGWISFGLCILIPNPIYFVMYASAGFICSGIAVFLYGMGLYTERHKKKSVEREQREQTV